MDAISINKILSGRDEDCAAYVQRYSGAGGGSLSHLPQQDKESSPVPLLYEAVISGMENEAKKATQTLLENTEPMEIINANLIPALNNAGETFASGKTFLPQLLKSAASATAAFEVIREHMASKGKNTTKRGKIVLATVKGDIHDIGKNIVKTLLENYNFEVYDLGKNVEPHEILQTVQKENAQLVGLSALMTTTVANMEETIALLRKHIPACKIMVGGAVLTETHAKKIGADFYSPDAMGAVRYAEEII